MLDSSVINELLGNSNVQSFLISVAAGAFWDGFKNVIGKDRNKDSLEMQTWETLKSTMQQFYVHKGYEYDDTIVMEALCKQYSLYSNVHEENLRIIIEETVYQGLTDADYSKWIDLFIGNCSANYIISNWILLQEPRKRVFTKRNLVLQRIEAKLKGYTGYNDDENSDKPYVRLNNVFGQLNELFDCSWKDEVLCLVSKLSKKVYNQEAIANKMSFIRSNEDCCDVLAQIEELILLYDFEKSNVEVKNKIFEILKWPHFNKVLVVTGTTGAGKSFFVREYVKNSIEMLKRETVKTVPCIIDGSKIKKRLNFEQTILRELGEFAGENVSSFEDACNLLDSLSIKICFVIDDLHSIVNTTSEWRNITKVIKRFSQYESFKWILTTNEYEYYIFEETQEFLQRYCIKKSALLGRDGEESIIFCNVLSIDELNRDWYVVEHILKEEFDICIPATYTGINKGITTPLEAIYFGECASGEELISFPSTYYEYIVKIVSWKSEALTKCSSVEIQQTVLKIIDCVIETRKCNIEKVDVSEADFNALRHAQLLSQIITKNSNVFSVSQAFSSMSYQLRVLPYWAAKMVGERFQTEKFDVGDLILFPNELAEWIIPCYIFFNSQNKVKLRSLFPILKNGSRLEYALFCAQRSSSDFCNVLYEFLIVNIDYISDSKSCYAVLYFVYGCPLKISQKFKLFCYMAEQVQKCNLSNLYERVFESIVRTSGNPKNLKRNMLELATCNISDINFINGYRTAETFMHLTKLEKKNIELMLWDLVDYIKDHSFILKWITLDGGHNCSFLDFFLRKCFEEYICSVNMQLKYVYQGLEKFFQLEYPIGSYIKRNLTCAAGNVFSSYRKRFSGYDEQYIQLVRVFSEKEKLYEKETAYFLIRNSLSENDIELNKELRIILSDIIKDKRIKKLYERDKNIFSVDSNLSR